MEKLINLTAAAELVGLSKSFVYHLAESRQIPFVRIGRRLLFRASSLEGWVEQNTVEPIDGSRRGRRG
jgi:excisionase family DNA binding protein